MQSYQNTVNNDPTERYLAAAPLDDTSWESVAEIEELLSGKCTSLAGNFPKSIFLPNLVIGSDRSAKCSGTVPRSGGFYDIIPPRSDEQIKSEECVDLDLLLNCDNLDERIATQQHGTANKATVADDFDLYSNNFGHQPHHRIEEVQAVPLAVVTPPPANTTTTTKNTFNSMDKSYNNISDKNDCNKNEYTTNKEYFSYNNNPVGDGYGSNSTSACQSPTNVMSMESSPVHHDYYYLHATEVSPEAALAGGDLFDAIDSVLTNDKLLLYTPDNSSGPFTDFPDNKVVGRKQQQPALTLNLKGTFINNDEINTPNIIDTIMQASEQPMFLTKEEPFNELPFFTPSTQELTPCPSTSPPTVITDTTDSFLNTLTKPSSSAIVAKKRGRPRKRRRTSEDFDDEDEDETYVPPVRYSGKRQRESRAVAAKKIIYHDDISEDEEEEDCKPPRKLAAQSRLAAPSYEEEMVRVGRRGRPPKHARSISSDDYSMLDPEEARYREMRDRNNEASRKSRYKRKQKEGKLSDTLEELELENVKLKAQVEELEKTVDRYRNNLMQVMLSKK